jgi:hypothetical protein
MVPSSAASHIRLPTRVEPWEQWSASLGLVEFQNTSCPRRDTGHGGRLAVGDGVPMSHVHGIPFREAVGVWAKVAALTCGGPAGQIALMHRILVEEKRWIGEDRFLACAQLLHAAARTGSAAAHGVHRLAAASHAWRRRRFRAL